MLNGEYRNKVQQSLLHLASSQLEQDNDASMLLATVAGAFLDSFLVNLKAELDEKKEIEHPDLESQQQAIKTSSKKILPKEFYVCRATPSYQVINTNIISSTLKRMRFPSIASQVEAESIEINKRRRDECFAAVQRLPFVSTIACSRFNRKWNYYKSRRSKSYDGRKKETSFSKKCQKERPFKKKAKER